jgi:hypothetical protein
MLNNNKNHFYSSIKHLKFVNSLVAYKVIKVFKGCDMMIKGLKSAQQVSNSSQDMYIL